MSPVGLVNPLASTALSRLDAPLPKIGLAQPGSRVGEGAGNFGPMLENIVAAVDAKQDAAQAVTRKVLLGDTEQLHQSVIAMQEASVALSLMVQVRNKLVESYQELMRMQA